MLLRGFVESHPIFLQPADPQDVHWPLFQFCSDEQGTKLHGEEFLTWNNHENTCFLQSQFTWVNPDPRSFSVWTDKIIVAFWLLMTTVREEVGMADSCIHSQKSSIFITTICMNNINEWTIGSIDSDCTCSLFKKRTSRIQTSDSKRRNISRSIWNFYLFNVIPNSDLAYLAAYEHTWPPNEWPAQWNWLFDQPACFNWLKR